MRLCIRQKIEKKSELDPDLYLMEGGSLSNPNLRPLHEWVDGKCQLMLFYASTDAESYIKRTQPHPETCEVCEVVVGINTISATPVKHDVSAHAA